MLLGPRTLIEADEALAKAVLVPFKATLAQDDILLYLSRCEQNVGESIIGLLFFLLVSVRNGFVIERIDNGNYGAIFGDCRGFVLG